ncbi:hypothetical protein [Streptomyces sp. NRRL F-5727]|uniref:hypothetical protein n=1 Tax=Streptomyces sp. NRRL F-5727 TaxID=1463871 RepID=UPI0004C4A7BB|nr:hypothetical protein [Streptomyces sp. NRRL F-5727]
MRPAPGDIVYAYRKTKPPSRRLLSLRLGLQHPVLRLNPMSVVDEHGNDWIEVLPVPHGVLDTVLDPDAVVLIPVADVAGHKESLPPEVLDVLLDVLDDGEPPWPTLREALGRGDGPTPAW